MNFHPPPLEAFLVFGRSTCNNRKISSSRQLQVSYRRINIILGKWGCMYVAIVKILSRTYGILLKIRRYLTTDTMKSISNSLFISFLQYDITVWGQAHESYWEPIFKLQKSYQDHIKPEIPFQSLASIQRFIFAWIIRLF